MKRIFGFVVVSIVLIGVCAAFNPANAGERYALLVGVRQYIKSELTPLKYTENDIAGLEQVLRKAGYPAENLVVMTQSSGAEDVRYLPTTENIQRELNLLLAEPTADDTVLIALSGHGVQFQGEKEVFFCPADARLKSRETLLSLESVYEALDACPAANKVLLVDACRNDPQSNLGKAAGEVQLEPVGRRAQPPVPPGGIAALFSCAAGQKSFEMPDLKRGVFFHFVIEGLAGKADSDGDQEVTLPELELFAGKQVKSYVRNQLSELQTPERRGESRGLVALTRLSEAVSPAVTSPSVPDATVTFAGKKAGEQRDDNVLKMKLCWCPPGGFVMGSPPDEPERGDDENQVQVTLTRGFWLGKYEVTRGEWESVMGTTVDDKRGGGESLDREEPCPVFGSGRRLVVLVPEGPDHPMIHVSYEDALKFCAKLTESERQAKRLPDGVAYRLPTEAQWEYACRAGTTSATAFGPSLSSNQANFEGKSYNGADEGVILSQTSPVGSYDPNRWGLHDMHGNVSEWCLDCYAKVLPGGKDPRVPNDSTERVRRGGSWWFDDGASCRSASRAKAEKELGDRSTGFRVALVQTEK
jgi:formylglycine-generating enzyme required for sulfatase activity